MEIDNVKYVTLTITTTLYTAISYLYGGLNEILLILLVFMIIDYITGIIKSFIHKNLSSNIGLRGIVKKILTLIVIAIPAMLDRILNDSSFIFRDAIIFFFIANEGISILENTAACGVQMPHFIINALEQVKRIGELKGKNNEETKEKEENKEEK